MSDLKTTIERHGQRWLDEPVYLHPKSPEIMSLAVRFALGEKNLRPNTQPLLARYDRVKLNWVSLDKLNKKE